MMATAVSRATLLECSSVAWPPSEKRAAAWPVRPSGRLGMTEGDGSASSGRPVEARRPSPAAPARPVRRKVLRSTLSGMEHLRKALPPTPGRDITLNSELGSQEFPHAGAAGEREEQRASFLG